MDRIRLGNATLTRVVEWQVDGLPVKVFPQTPPEAWRELADEFAPTFWNDDGWRIALQTGCRGRRADRAGRHRGRQRPRPPAMPPFDHLNTDFLEITDERRFRPRDRRRRRSTPTCTPTTSAGTPWRDGDEWVPTFPNARYLMPEADYRHFHPDNAAQRPTPRTEDEAARQAGSPEWCSRTAFSPVEEQIELWSDDHQLTESLRLRPAPGHTPGASVVWLDAGKPAVFVGDLTHCPMQLHRPNDPCAWDEDFAAAAVTRKRVLTEASRRRAAVIPAHYPGHGGATVVARGDAFMVDDWLELPPI